MKSIKKTVFIWVTCLAMTSCTKETIRVSSEVSTREYDLGTITALDVATDFKAYITFSETDEGVSVQANDNLFERINLYKDGEKLTVKLDNNLNIRGKETLNLFITTRYIDNFKASSDASIVLESTLDAQDVYINLSSDAYFEGDVTADNFELRASSDAVANLYVEATGAYLDLSSGAKLRGEAHFNETVMDLSSDAEIDVIGSIGNLDAKLSSDSTLKDYGLEVENLKIALSSDSNAYLSVSNTIDVEVSSDARLYYQGNAEIVRQFVSSDGRVIKK